MPYLALLLRVLRVLRVRHESGGLLMMLDFYYLLIRVSKGVGDDSTTVNAG